MIDELRHLVDLATEALRDLAHSGWSSASERRALSMADSIDEAMRRILEDKDKSETRRSHD